MQGEITCDRGLWLVTPGGGGAAGSWHLSAEATGPPTGRRSALHRGGARGAQGTASEAWLLHRGEGKG